jgi:hypothetical protein
VLLSNDICGVFLHWLGDRSFPCLGDACELDHGAEAPRWYGYAPLVVPNFSVPTLVGVSPQAAGQLEYLDGVYNGTRGLAVRFTRKSSLRSRVLVEVVDERKRVSIPPPFDPRPYLLEMWGLFEPLTSEETEEKPATEEQRHRLGEVLHGLFDGKGYLDGR